MHRALTGVALATALLGSAAAISVAVPAPAIAASMPGSSQCQLLAGKRYLIEIEDGITITTGVFAFNAADKNGKVGSGMHYRFDTALVPPATPTIGGAAQTFTTQDNPDQPSISLRGPTCGITTPTSAYYAFQTAAGDEQAVKSGQKAPKLLFGNSTFQGKLAAVYVLPTPFKPTN